MKYLISINEGFKLVNLNNSNWFGKKPSEDYIQSVKDSCTHIIMEEFQISEKSFSIVDRVIAEQNKVLLEREEEFNAIAHNCKNLNMRPQYAAESVFHTILRGKIDAMFERDKIMHITEKKNYKKIDGEIYDLKYSSPLRFRADKIADEERKKGKSARVINMNDEWNVFIK